MTEKILAVRTKLLEPFIGGKTGLISEKNEEIIQIINANFEFIDREAAESDPGYKQIIPYVVILRGDEIFTTRRLSKGGEKRLHGLLSIGIGGHINPVDNESENTLMAGLMRELNEEVSVEISKKLRFMGVINDDTNSVGSVHLGLLFTMRVNGDVQVRETEKLVGEWMSEKEILERGEMETWTKIALEAI